MKDHSEVEAFYACKQPLHFWCSVVELQILPILAMQGFWERTLYQPLSYCKKCIYMYALYLSVQKYLFISNWSTNHKMPPRATLDAWKQSAAFFQFKVQRGNFIFSATHKMLTLGLSTKYPTPTLAPTQSCTNLFLLIPKSTTERMKHITDRQFFSCSILMIKWWVTSSWGEINLIQWMHNKPVQVCRYAVVYDLWQGSNKTCPIVFTKDVANTALLTKHSWNE